MENETKKQLKEDDHISARQQQEPTKTDDKTKTGPKDLVAKQTTDIPVHSAEPTSRDTEPEEDTLDQRATDGGDDEELDPDYIPEEIPESEDPSPVDQVEIVHNTSSIAKEAPEKTEIRKPAEQKQDRITNTIHQIWWQGQDKIPEHYHKLVQTWKDLHPGTRYILWDEKMITSLIENHPALNPFVATFHQYKEMIQKIDFGKVCILFVFGGVYVDMDCEAVKNIWPTILPYHCILSQCYMSSTIAWMSKIAKMKPFSETHINNAFMGCVPNHKLMFMTLLKMVDTANNHKKSLSEHLSHAVYILCTTGPNILASCYLRYKSQYPRDISICLFESKYFEPRVLSWKDKKVEIENETCSVHWSHMNWLKGSKTMKILPIVIFLIVLVVVLGVFYVVSRRRNKKQIEDGKSPKKIQNEEYVMLDKSSAEKAYDRLDTTTPEKKHKHKHHHKKDHTPLSLEKHKTPLKNRFYSTTETPTML